MCGIAGFLDFSHQQIDAARRQRILDDMGFAISRRGPDDQQCYDDGTLAFVFRRLSIIDVAGGRQPIWNEDESIFVSVNGEIYNHRQLRETLGDRHQFRTDSDSEVVLHLYEEHGEDCFRLLNGMFAVALWDARNKKLVLARDRLGVKPLYYTLTERGVIFGSELKALLQHPDCPREMAWDDLEIIGVQQKQEISTYVRGVRFLPAGHYAVMAPDREFSPRTFWLIDDHIRHETEDVDVQYYRRIYVELLEDSVTKRLMSDVPVGLFLSGGVDSSLIAAIAATQTKNLHCFTIIERTTVLAGDVQQAFSVCESLGLPLYAAQFDVAELAGAFSLEDFERQIALIESPRFDPEWYFKNELHKFARRQVPDIKVILLGQGADEFAGGYSARLGAHYQNWDEYLRDEVDPDIDYYWLKEQAIPPRFTPLLRPAYRRQSAACRPHDYHSKMKLLTYQLQHFNLWHEDRTSSYEGIEARVPFLDYRLVELAASIPDRCHEALFWDKDIVRTALDRWLPSYPRAKKKVPFFVTDRVSVIDHFALQVATSLYPRFRLSYLDQDDSVFDAERVDRVYHGLVQRAGDYLYQAWYLLELMAIAVFQRLCRQPERLLEIVGRPSTSAIRRIDREQFAGLEQQYLRETEPRGQRLWALDTRVRIVPGCQIVTPLLEGDDRMRLLLVRDGRIVNQIDLPGEDAWVAAVLERMVELDDEYRDLKTWSEKVDVDMQALVNAFDQLVSIGFLEQVMGGVAQAPALH